VLLIPGATGDAGHFTRAADRLADEFTVITYDRRGNSRSALTPEAPDSAGIAPQADDAAALIRACGFVEAVVFGTSGGAEIALELVLRNPTVVRAALVHEPPLFTVLPPLEGHNPIEPILRLAETDPRAALEAFVKANSSDTAWESLERDTRERMLGNALTLFGRELDEFVSYRPDPHLLSASDVPVVLLRSRDGLPFAEPVQAWLQAQLCVETAILSGHHAPYLETPELFAEELRPILRNLWS
jgi:pimeloyl-ACP methyl ester carboxylesterase